MVTKEYLEGKLAKSQVDLKRWQSKLKRAKTAIRKLNVRVRYYERKNKEWKPPAPVKPQSLRRMAVQ